MLPSKRVPINIDVHVNNHHTVLVLFKRAAIHSLPACAELIGTIYQLWRSNMR